MALITIILLEVFSGNEMQIISIAIKTLAFTLGYIIADILWDLTLKLANKLNA